MRVAGRQSAHYLYKPVHITVTFAVRNCQSSETLCHVSVINVHFRNISMLSNTHDKKIQSLSCT